MVIARSHLASICLFFIACSIAITEYFFYSPTMVSDVSEDLFTQEQEEQEADENSSEAFDTDSQTAETNDEEQEDDQSETSPRNSDSNINKKEAQKKTSEKEDAALLPFSKSLTQTASIEPGETISKALDKLGFSRGDVHLASKALAKILNLKHIKAGQKIDITAKKNSDGTLVLDVLEIQPDALTKIVVTRQSSGEFFAEKTKMPVKKVIRSVSGFITPKSPKYSLQKCGIKTSIVHETLKILNNVANTKAAKSDIGFEILYSDYYNKAGEVVAKPALLYVSAIVGGKIYKIYKFQTVGQTKYVDNAGKVLFSSNAKQQPFLIRPIRATRISSHFGLRKDPFHGRTKRHTGVDFAASIGTPVVASAAGTVTRASHYHGYGKYVSIKHSPSIDTAYGHLSKIVVHHGQKVAQGQLIGYSGVSGRSTGPHLHYELKKYGQYANPLSLTKLVDTESSHLSKTENAKFNQFKREINLQVVGLSSTVGCSKKIAPPKFTKY